jgi:hypothetical protein
MGRTDRRLFRWAIISLLLLVSMLSAAFLAFWYVVWPFSPGFVILHSPWTVPFVRAYGILADTSENVEVWDEGRIRFSRMVVAQSADVQNGLVACMRDTNPDAQWAAIDLIHLVAKEGPLSAELCSEIVRATKDEDVGVRNAACSAVRFLPREQAVQILHDKFDSGDKDLQFISVYSMARLGDYTLSPKIVPWLQNPQVEVRRWAAQLLSISRDPEVIPILTPFLGDPDQDIRISVGRFLRDVNQPFEE